MSISPDPNSLVTGLYLQIRTLESALAAERQQNAELQKRIEIYSACSNTAGIDALHAEVAELLKSLERAVKALESFEEVDAWLGRIRDADRHATFHGELSATGGTCGGYQTKESEYAEAARAATSARHIINSVKRKA